MLRYQLPSSLPPLLINGFGPQISILLFNVLSMSYFCGSVERGPGRAVEHIRRQRSVRNHWRPESDVDVGPGDKGDNEAVPERNGHHEDAAWAALSRYVVLLSFGRLTSYRLGNKIMGQRNRTGFEKRNIVRFLWKPHRTHNTPKCVGENFKYPNVRRFAWHVV